MVIDSSIIFKEQWESEASSFDSFLILLFVNEAALSLAPTISIGKWGIAVLPPPGTLREICGIKPSPY